jgi:hypothetical protein
MLKNMGRCLAYLNSAKKLLTARLYYDQKVVHGDRIYTRHPFYGEEVATDTHTYGFTPS